MEKSEKIKQISRHCIKIKFEGSSKGTSIKLMMALMLTQCGGKQMCWLKKKKQQANKRKYEKQMWKMWLKWPRSRERGREGKSKIGSKVRAELPFGLRKFHYPKRREAATILNWNYLDGTPKHTHTHIDIIWYVVCVVCWCPAANALRLVHCSNAQSPLLFHSALVYPVKTGNCETEVFLNIDICRNYVYYK